MLLGQIGDPKMDSGCVAPGEKFEEEYDVSRRLLPEEVLGIIDELICHEVCVAEFSNNGPRRLYANNTRFHGILATRCRRHCSPVSISRHFPCLTQPALERPSS